MAMCNYTVNWGYSSQINCELATFNRERQATANLGPIKIGR